LVAVGSLYILMRLTKRWTPAV